MTAWYLTEISSIKKRIIDLDIQGATNIALATIEGIEIALTTISDRDINLLKDSIKRIGENLSNARPNEPLARNAVKYILSTIKTQTNVEALKKKAFQAIKSYKELIYYSNAKIVKNGLNILDRKRVILTHCHSSTSVNILKKLATYHEVTVVTTETRPRFQGRMTATELTEAGVRTYMIIDSSAASFIVDDRFLPVDSVLIGADEIYANGSFLNKVGSYGISLAAKIGSDPVYVATSLLKLDLHKQPDWKNIEIRDEKEIWQNSPEGLKIIDQSFDLVDGNLVSGGFITEAGILKYDELASKALELYPWIE